MEDREEEREEGMIVYYDTSCLGVEVSSFNVCFSWDEPLEELSNKNIETHVVVPQKTA